MHFPLHNTLCLQLHADKRLPRPSFNPVDCIEIYTTHSTDTLPPKSSGWRAISRFVVWNRGIDEGQPPAMTSANNTPPLPSFSPSNRRPSYATVAAGINPSRFNTLAAFGAPQNSSSASLPQQNTHSPPMSRQRSRSSLRSMEIDGAGSWKRPRQVGLIRYFLPFPPDISAPVSRSTSCILQSSMLHCKLQFILSSLVQSHRVTTICHPKLVDS